MHTKHQAEFSSFDGTKLFYQYWPVDSLNKGPTVVILLHQEDEENTDSTALIEAINLPQYSFFTLSLRYSVCSANNDISTFSILVRDFYEFVSQIKVDYGLQESNIIVIGEYITALVITAWLHDYAPQIKAAILLTPAFSLKKGYNRCRLSKVYSQKQKHNIKSLATTGNISLLSSYTKVKEQTIHSFVRLGDTAKRIVLDASAIYTPIVMLINEQETLVKQTDQKYFFNNLSSNYKRLELFFNHQVDEDKYFIANKISQVIKELVNIDQTLPMLLDADLKGKTKEEFDKLAAPETHLLKRMCWVISRNFLQYIGIFSNGVRIGLTHGFDSGLSLDYIYQNIPSGSNFLGKILDKIYLNNRSWQSVRERKKHVEELVLLAIDKLIENRQAVNILDVAAGNGRYLIDFIKQHSKKIDHVLMRDFVDINIQQGLLTLKEQQLTEWIDFEWGDAFNEQSLATIPKNKTIAIASGFYELFNDNKMVLRSLKGIAEVLEEGGFLIFTTKIWNPSLEYMARVMSSHKDGQAWLLRRRHQLEIDQLMTEAGFSKVTQRVGQWGIFTVTLVQKRCS